MKRKKKMPGEKVLEKSFSRCLWFTLICLWLVYPDPSCLNLTNPTNKGSHIFLPNCQNFRLKWKSYSNQHYVEIGTVSESYTVVKKFHMFILPVSGSAGSTGRATHRRFSATEPSYVHRYCVSGGTDRIKISSLSDRTLKKENTFLSALVCHVEICACSLLSPHRGQIVGVGHARRTKQSHKKVLQSQLSMLLCKLQPARHEVICRYVCNLNHMVHRSRSEVRLPSELLSEPWQQHYRASEREFGLRCSRPDEHKGRARWQADQEAETGRCQPGCL